MEFNSIVRDQFNKQASNFDKWDTPKNLEYLENFSRFVALAENDTLLDIASGTGDFVVYSAPKVKKAVGIDISDKMVQLSLEKQQRDNLTNIEFHIGDAEHLPFPSASFDLVVCKSSLHHMPQYERVFGEMLRCCTPSGRVALCDIMAYEEPIVDRFFEDFEKIVDISHVETLTKAEFFGLYRANNMEVLHTQEVEIHYTITEYLTHAIQSELNLLKLDHLLKQITKIDKMPQYWNCLNGNQDVMTFTRKVFLIVGKKIKV
jgi:ubiquinone/menaquinone biosynthesis C-methylase UbiE